jgi:hypothetical protein
MEHWRNDTEEKQKQKKTYPSATLSTTDLTWSDLESNLVVCSEPWHVRFLKI